MGGIKSPHAGSEVTIATTLHKCALTIEIYFSSTVEEVVKIGVKTPGVSNYGLARPPVIKSGAYRY